VYDREKRWGGKTGEGRKEGVEGLTDIKARYLTSGFSCVMSSMTLVLAPRAFTSLQKRDEKRRGRGSVRRFLVGREREANRIEDSLLAPLAMLDVLTNVGTGDGEHESVRGVEEEVDEGPGERWEGRSASRRREGKGEETRDETSGLTSKALHLVRST